MPSFPSLDDLIRARNGAAYIVANHGEKFLPIFQRLDREVAEATIREQALAKARAMATARA